MSKASITNYTTPEEKPPVTLGQLTPGDCFFMLRSDGKMSGPYIKVLSATHQGDIIHMPTGRECQWAASTKVLPVAQVNCTLKV